MTLTTTMAHDGQPGSHLPPSRSASSSNLSVAPPTQLVLGSADDAEAARRNFIEREQASRTFLAFLPFRKKRVTPLQRRHSHNDLSNDELESPTKGAESPSKAALPSSPSGSRFTGISVNSDRGDDEVCFRDEEDKEATRWAFVYENQRGCVSSLSLTMVKTLSVCKDFMVPNIQILQ